MFEGFKVIFVEDDAPVRNSLAQTLELAGMQVHAFASAEDALPHIHPDLQGIVISDVRLQGQDGVTFLKAVVQQDADIPVILITAHGDVNMAVQAMRAGAYDFIEKPFSPERFVDTAARAMEKRVLRLAVNTLRQQLHEKTGIEAVLLGDSMVMQQVRAQILRLAPTSADVMVVGETGTGKELVARCLHDHSPRRDRHFVAINCGGLPDGLLESELFGHEIGAFTTANKRRIGKFEHAHGGTLLLDEIESMPMSFQVKLLRVLQERKINRLGSNHDLAVDVRVIAATKSDLFALSQAQQFRSDLYYRLNVAVLTLPPLRDRKQDLPLLFERFVAQAAQRYGLPAPTIDSAQMALWTAHDWPGNVREARNAADRFVLQLPELPEAPAEATTGGNRLAQQMDAVEKSLIEKALKEHHGSASAVIAALGIGKKTLYEKLRRHNITINEFR